MRNNEIIIKNNKIIHISFRPRSLCVGSYLKLPNPLPTGKTENFKHFPPQGHKGRSCPGYYLGMVVTVGNQRCCSVYRIEQYLHFIISFVIAILCSNRLTGSIKEGLFPAPPPPSHMQTHTPSNANFSPYRAVKNKSTISVKGPISCILLCRFHAYYPHLTVCYLCVTPCIRMLLLCYSYVSVCARMTRNYSYVLVCYSQCSCGVLVTIL